MGTLVSTAVAAHALGVSPAAIRMLRTRGKLTRHGSKQRALVDIDELTELAAGRLNGDSLRAQDPEGA